MTRPNYRRSPGVEGLETRELLSAGGPSDTQQLALELINLARTNPPAAAERLTSNLSADVKSTLAHYNVDLAATKNAIASSSPKPPVAWNDSLAAVAQGHSQDMAANQFQSHSGSDGSSASQRIARSGVGTTSSDGENAYAYATSVDQAMQAFLIDWGVSDQGHRRNIQQPNVSDSNSYTDVGVGIATTSTTTKVGPMVITQDFARRSNAQPQLLGTIFVDNNGDQFYAPGEGQGDVKINAVNLDTGAVTSTTSWSSGGYQMALSPGRYQVTASVSNTVIKSVTLAIDSENVEQDFITSQPWDGRSVAQIASISQKGILSVNATLPQGPIKMGTLSSAASTAQSSAKTGAWVAWQAKHS